MNHHSHHHHHHSATKEPSTHDAATNAQDPTDVAGFWDALYGERPRIWSGSVNRALADTAPALAPGAALDLGCGEGGDSVWLAEAGWQVTGVDISATALERARELAENRGVGDRITWQLLDLAQEFPPGQFDLVSACFLASPVELPRSAVLQRALDAVAPGGTLLLVSHAAPPPWAGEVQHGHGPEFRSPDQELAMLDLDDSAWEVLRAEVRSREATGPDGEAAALEDTVVVIRRR